MSSVSTFLRDGILTVVWWWIDGLWMGLPLRWRQQLFRERDDVLVRIGDETAWIEVRSGGSKSSEPETFEIPLQDAPRAAGSVRSRCDVVNANVTVVLPAATALTKSMSMPESAERELDRVLHYEMDRLLPAPVEDFVVRHEIKEHLPLAGSIRVQVSLIRRETLSRWLHSISQLELEPRVVTVAEADGSYLRANFIEAPRKPRLPFVEWPFKPLVAGTALLVSFIALYVPLCRYASLIENHEHTVAAMRERAVAARSAAARRAAEFERAAFLDTVRSNYTPPLLLLEKLSETLPDRAWITRFHLTQEEVRLEGDATQASSLLELVAAMDELERAEFRAPVSISGPSGKEQFSIVAQLEQVPE